MEDHSMQPSMGAAMKALANLFQTTDDHTPVQERLNPHDVLLGLSVLFKKIAMASESNPTNELELGLLDSSSSRLEHPEHPFPHAGRSDPLETSHSVDSSVTDAIIQSLTDADEPSNICTMGMFTEQANEEWNPRQFLEKRSYSKLELDALEHRGFFSPNLNQPENLDSFDLDILNRLCYAHFKKDDLKIASQIHEKGDWILSAKLRTLLFSELYVPMLQEYNQNTWQVLLHVSVDSRLKLLRQFQDFTLYTLSIASKNTVNDVQLPCLQYFVEDAVLLLRILNKAAVLSSSFEESHPFNEFNTRRRRSWSKRWNLCSPDSEEVWRDYICGLCDALFGLWPASGPGLFHKTNGVTGCVGTLLRAFIHGQRDSSVVPHIDYHRLDAAYIESRGPFRIKRTNCLDDHLLMTENNEILFYADWQKWACLTSLSVLHSKNSPSLFDVLMCAHRRGWRPQPISVQIRTSLSQIFGDLATTGMLFFFQDNIHNLEQKKELHISLTNRVKNFVAHHFPSITSSEKIAKRIGLSMSESDLVYARAFLEYCNDDWARLVNENTLFRTVSPFKDRLDKLHDELNTWKPKTVWELRYTGYGGVDPVGLYAFYFAAALGIITMIGLGIGIAQTYAAFKVLK